MSTTSRFTDLSRLAFAVSSVTLFAACGDAASGDPQRRGEPSIVAQTEAALETATVVAKGLRNVNAIATDASSVYWAEDDDANPSGTGKISKAPLAGGAVSDVATGQATPVRMALDAAHVYWATQAGSNGSILKAALAGGTITTLLPAQAYFITDLILGGKKLYWATVQVGFGDDLWSMATDGSALAGLPGTGGLPTENLAWSASTLFVSDGGLVDYYSTKDQFLFPEFLLPQESNPAITAVGNTLFFMGGNASSTGTAIFTHVASKQPGQTPTMLDGGDHGKAPWGSNLASDGTAVYWTACDDGTGARPCRLLRNVAGATTVLANHKTSNGVVALSSTSVYWGVDGAVLRLAK